MNPALNIEVQNKCPEQPFVSVCITTYNHDAYIRQCVDSVLRQKTDFDFEILIGEDNSKDSTRAVCLELAESHPDKIRLFLNDRSNVLYVNGRPTGRNNLKHLFKKARGKYIAFIEGDDYYVDSFKLQKQVEALENAANAVVCSTSCTRLDEGSSLKNALKVVSGEYTFDEVLRGEVSVYTCTIMYKRLPDLYFPDWYDATPYGDLPLVQIHLSRGNLISLSDNTAVYRVHAHGYYSGVQPTKRARMYLETINVLTKNLRSINPAAQQKVFVVPLSNAYYRLAYSAAGSGDKKTAIQYFLGYFLLENRYHKSLMRLFLFPFILLRIYKPTLG